MSQTGHGASASPNEKVPRPGGHSLLGAVLALLVVGGAGLLWASGMVWAAHTVERAEPLPPLAYTMTGATAVPMVVAAGFILLAALVAVLATKIVGRRVVAVIVLLTAAVTGIAIGRWSGQSADQRAASMLVDGVRHAVEQAPAVTSPAVPLAAVSLVLGAVAAVLLLVTRGPVLMGSKYERGSTRIEPARPAADDDPQSRDRDLWSSLDRGEDPTD